MSLTSILSIARSGLIVQQNAIDVAGHNIANATTPGYTRQTLNISAATPMQTPFGTVGRGVTDNGVVSSRNAFLDAAYRAEQGNAGDASTMHSMLSQVEQVFGEPSDSGLASTLDSFFSAWSDLANDPSSAPNRTAVQQAGLQVVQLFHDLSSRIDTIDQNARATVTDSVSQINTIAQQIADLNNQIVSLGGPNHSAPDLVDQRGVLLDQLSNLVSVRVLDRGNGSVGVVVGDSLLVDGGAAQQVQVTGLPNGGLGIGYAGFGGIINAGSGKLNALATLTDQTLPGVRQQLDQLANAIVTSVNGLHELGTTPGGTTNTDFFDPAGVTANAIALAAPIAASGSNIAAGGTAAAGDGSIALQLAQMRTQGIGALGGVTMNGFYTALTGSLGAQVNSANQRSSAADTLVANASQQRSSETGVSTDEELTSLMVSQQAYAAAARLVNVANSMMDDLLSMVQ